jgi:acyl-CoA thioester hydrolase
VTGAIEVPLRWVDVDALGHVYHATYLTLLDEARSRFLTALGVRSPSDHVVARVEVDYLAPVGPGHDHVLVRHGVERVGRTSLTLRAVLATADGVDRARARVVVVLWDVAAGAPRPVGDDERTALEAPAAQVPVEEV